MAFWAHTRRKLRTKCGVSPLLADVKDKDSLKFNDEEKANILQKQFSSVIRKNQKTTYRHGIADLHVTPKMVQKELLNLNINKSCGPD